jgi:hypothetical protein
MFTLVAKEEIGRSGSHQLPACVTRVGSPAGSKLRLRALQDSKTMDPLTGLSRGPKSNKLAIGVSKVAWTLGQPPDSGGGLQELSPLPGFWPDLELTRDSLQCKRES